MSTRVTASAGSAIVFLLICMTLFGGISNIVGHIVMRLF